MDTPIFDPQQPSTAGKIAVGLARISEAYRAQLWNHAKVMGISPIQIQMLIFMRYHLKNMCTVSQLAREFNVAKPTVSDAVQSLLKKQLVQKEVNQWRLTNNQS